MILTELDAQEIEIIREAAELEVDTLDELLHEDDITLEAIKLEVEELELKEAMKDKRESFNRVIDTPEQIFNILTWENLSLFKHILCLHIPNSPAKARVFRKLDVFESFTQLYTLN